MSVRRVPTRSRWAALALMTSLVAPLIGCGGEEAPAPTADEAVVVPGSEGPSPEKLESGRPG